MQIDEIEEIGNGLLNLNDEPEEENDDSGHVGPITMTLGFVACIGESSAASTNQQIPEDVEEAMVVLALQAHPVNFLHLETQPHELNVINSQGEVIAESSGPVQENQQEQVVQIPDPNSAIIPSQVEGVEQSFHSTAPIDENLNVGLVLLPKTTDVDPGIEAHLVSKEMMDWTAKQKADSMRLWTKYFAPVSASGGIQVPHHWCDFITMVLLDPSRFEWAKALLGSKA
jgi:hypothetical protein